MNKLEDVQNWRGKNVVDADGDKIGTIEDVFLDRHTGEPEWATVKTGLFVLKSSFVPIRDAQVTGDDEVRVPFQKEQVKDAPRSTPTAGCRPIRSGSCGSTTAGPTMTSCRARTARRRWTCPTTAAMPSARLRQMVVTMGRRRSWGCAATRDRRGSQPKRDGPRSSARPPPSAAPRCRLEVRGGEPRRGPRSRGRTA
jgi:sporulation protein YlmC with PRC-barrel domain